MKYGLHFRMLSVLALCLFGTSHIWAQQTNTVYYSTTGRSSFSRTCPLTILGATCGSISNEANAVDANFDTFATLRSSILLGPVALRMDMSGIVPKNHRAGVVIGTSTGLSAIGTVKVHTYLGTAPKQTLDVTSLAQTALGSTQPGRIEFLATEAFDKIELEVGALLNLSYDVRVYYAYGIDANLVETASGVVSRFATPTEGSNYSTAVVDNTVTVCANSGVLNPERAADQTLTNYATFTTLAGVSCPSTLRVKLEAPSLAGYYAGFVVGEQSLLDLSALTGLRITTYKNGVAQETATGAQLLQITVLPEGKQQVSFPTTLAFDEVQITRSSAVSALDNLALYYGFGLEPSVFRDQTPVLSNFSSGAGQFAIASDGVLCVLCANTSVLNPERAADGNMSSNDYATMRTGLAGALTSTALRLNLNGSGEAGNSAGVVLNQGSGLLNTQLLNGITLRTYGGPNGDRLLETASGASLLQQGLLPDGRAEVFFRTTQDFQRVEIEVNNAVSALDQTRIYYAFAQDRPLGFPKIINALAAPLPVKLKSFQAKAVGRKVEVTWQTALEASNSYFVVERAQQAKGSFATLGQVEGSGTSANGKSYSFDDETVAALGATTLYYRLRQVDTDGKESLSPVMVVKLSEQAAAGVEVYPNPAATSAEVRIRTYESKATALAIYNMHGTLLRQIPVTESTLQLVDTTLPAGLYHLVLLGGRGQLLSTQKLVVTGR
ncbi:T9SS type A sorting domain-containing protein [Hymenobacter volaticus]|uniref:T9SS type A sorting domain-containing protein n=1 Tax=Hymenobacter volaticus TaxID=2932254 RepID=A0ABY4G4Z1_9BACT|nr:T9SS type A sorting domain-containing protein [Hymenobacter volaticus]UOQ65948.1 T9SS type A sorting domain-containing protein [Hymenobacter volaticus]